MRGLEVRVAFASAIVLISIDKEAGNDQMESVFDLAQEVGAKDFEKNCTDVPVFFRDVPMLVQGWKKGFEYAAVDQAIYRMECK